MAQYKSQGDRYLRYLLTFGPNGSEFETYSPTIKRLERKGRISVLGNRATLTERGKQRLSELGFRMDNEV